MPFVLRPLEESDIHESEQIEREAFPNQFPPTSFRRELKNRIARYLVACRRDAATDTWSSTSAAPGVPGKNRSSPLMGTLIRGARKLWDGSHPGHELVAGFLGVWYMVDEAHIVSVGVRRLYRGQGIGELLLIGAIEQAMASGVSAVSLEVRPSNGVARNLYRKYGFEDRGIRKGYYADNREDAIIMTTSPIHAPPYPDRFRQQEREHRWRWGRAERAVL